MSPHPQDGPADSFAGAEPTKPSPGQEVRRKQAGNGAGDERGELRTQSRFDARTLQQARNFWQKPKKLALRSFKKNRLRTKKSLPNVAIPGIPRLHAATGLPRIGNYIASCPFQRSRARADAHSLNIGFYEPRSEDRGRHGTSDHG